MTRLYAVAIGLSSAISNEPTNGSLTLQLLVGSIGVMETFNDPNHLTPWNRFRQESLERRAAAFQMRSDGKPVLEIARTLGVSPQAVYDMIRKAQATQPGSVPQ